MIEVQKRPETVVILTADRRRNRLALPQCPECAREQPGVVMRTGFVLYLRCVCGVVWSAWKPAAS